MNVEVIECATLIRQSVDLFGVIALEGIAAASGRGQRIARTRDGRALQGHGILERGVYGG